MAKPVDTGTFDPTVMAGDPNAALAGMMGMMGAMGMVFVIVALAVFVFWIFLQWKIFSKAGFSGALALINIAVIIPLIGPLIVLGLQTWFAFAAWPALKGGGAKT